MPDNARLKPNLKTLADMIARETALKIRTTIPARVLEYHDGPPSTAKLEISAQQVERDRDGNEGVREAFIIDDVPVWQMGGVQSYIRVPLQTGDEGVILVCDRSIGSWRADGLAHPPPAPWLHNPGECVFLPGFRPDTIAFQALPATMGGAVFEAQAIQLGVGATQAFVLGQLFDAMWQQLFTYVTTHTHAVAALPSVGSPPPLIPTLPPSIAPGGTPFVPLPPATIAPALSTKVFGE